MKDMKLTVVITSYNNQDLIKDCVNSVKFADEVIIVDNGSSDDTVKIAKQLGAKIFTHPNDPTKLNQAKNFGFNKASGDWILSLDSDERVESDLKQEIQELMKQESINTNGFSFPRKNIIFGKWIRHGLWYPDDQVRLFRKGKGKFPVVHQHEYLRVEGKVGKLNGHLSHLNYQTISQYLQKIDRQYSGNEAEVFLQNGGQIHWFDAIRFPGQDFLSNYFMRQAYKDGLHGLVLSLLQAFYMFVVFCKIWEMEGFKPKKMTLDESNREFWRIFKQFRYWFLLAKSQGASLPQKFWLKLQGWF